MGSKKKEKKKKKRRHSSGEEDSPRGDDYGADDKKYTSKKSRYDDDVPQTEEYVYDYTGQEVVSSSSRRRSRSPEDRYSRSSRKDKSPSRRERRTRGSSPSQPPPPGTDWSNDEPKNDLEDGELDWKQADDMKRDREYQDEVDRKYREKQKADKRKNRSPSPPKASTKDDSSLSIEETNKVREKLGLKPLKIGSETGGEEKSYEDREDVHKPATNIAEKKYSDKMREKMEAIREKRKMNQKLKKVKGLGEEDDPALDSAAAWVAKSRVAEKEKAMAEKRAQVLEEMDEEFGISGLMEETASKIKKEPSYTSRDLRGLTVQHKASDIGDGSEVILTLEDKGILEDDEDDVLLNVNIRDDETTKKNVKNRNKRPGYQAYDEVDDETGMLKVRSVLDKYDEEIDGAQKKSFKLDNIGRADGEDAVEEIRATLKAQQVSLEMAAPSLARDYFTEEEMVKFKKPRKKVRKVRKREVLKADDLLRLDVDMIKDRGSRKSKVKTDTKKTQDKSSQGEEDMDIVPSMPDELDYFVALRQHEEPDPILEDDEAEQELQIALQRSRRTVMDRDKTDNDNADDKLHKMAMNLLNKPKVEETMTQTETHQTSTKSKKKGRGTIVLDSTSEFCRTLGELPTVGPSRVKAEETKPESKEDEPMKSATTGGWEQVDMSEPMDIAADIKEEEDDDVLEPEPIPHGMAATLTLANMKGYLKEGKEKVRNFDPLNLPETKASVDVDKLRDEEKGRYGGRGYDRGERYDPYSFKEKSNYKPEIKLEYVDDKGRRLNQKEAFRLLSHKFHGKGSGKQKTEKRAKKLQEEKKLQMMSSIDTPLNTAAMFKDKQKASQSAYLVLSGGGKNLLTK